MIVELSSEPVVAIAHNIWERERNDLTDFLCEKQVLGYEPKTFKPVTKSLRLLRSNIPEAAAHFHLNYVEYLSRCWATHWGAVVDPAVLWNLFLTEIAKQVVKDPEPYQHLFTTKAAGAEKIEIVVEADPEMIFNIPAVMEKLQELVPTDTGRFFPEFTTRTPASFNADRAAFAEMASPFYNYSMYCCAITRIDIRGTLVDWQLFGARLEDLGEILPAATDRAYIGRFLNYIKLIAGTWDQPDKASWKNMFRLEKCGSGHQVEVKGWIRDLCYEKVPSPTYVDNFPSMVAVVPFKIIPGNQKCKLKMGLFSSKVQDGFLVPEFSHVVVDVTEGG